MMARRALTALALVAALSWPGAARAWLARLQGAHPQVEDFGRAVVAVAGGETVTAATTHANPGGCEVTVRRLGRDGRERWRRRLGWTFCDLVGEDRRRLPLAMAADETRVLVGLPGFVVAALDVRSGLEVWRTAVGPDYPLTDGRVADLALDAAGDVIAAGSIDAAADGDVYDSDLLVAKLSGQGGAVLWRAERSGALGPCDPEDCDGDRRAEDAARALALDDAGDALVAGVMETPAGRRFTVLAFDGASGAERWRHDEAGEAAAVLTSAGAVYASGSDGQGGVVVRLRATDGALSWRQVQGGGTGIVEEVRSLALAGDGSLAAAATIDRVATRSSDLTVRLLRAEDGETLWQRELASREAERVVAQQVLAGPDEDVGVVATREQPDAGGGTYGEVRLLARATGADRWLAQVGDPDTGEGIALAAARAADGTLLAAGSARDGEERVAAVAVALAPGDGSERWRATTTGGFRGDDQLGGLAVDRSGDVVVTGSVENAGPSGGVEQAFVIGKLAGRSGRERWRVELDGTDRYEPGFTWDEGRNVAIDPAGDVLAAGTLETAEFDTDAAVLKLDGETGEERWRTLLRGSDEYARDFGVDVASDAAGDVLALATLTPPPPGAPGHVLVKLAGDDGRERWRRATEAFRGSFAPLSDGDVVTAGTAFGATPTAIVRRLGSEDGADLWLALVPDALAACVSASEDAVALAVQLGREESDAVVALLDARTGGERWRTLLSAPSERPAYTARVVMDRDGYVFASGEITQGALPSSFVAKIDGETGTVLWRRVVAGDAQEPTFLAPWYGGLVVAPAGVVAAALPLRDHPANYDFAVLGFDARSGRERWRFVVDGTATQGTFDPDTADLDRADAIALGPSGVVVAGGVTRWNETGADLTVATLDARRGSLAMSGRDRRCARALRHVRETIARLGSPVDSPRPRATLAHLAPRLRGHIARACRPARLFRVGACATVVDDLLDRTGASGCLLRPALR